MKTSEAGEIVQILAAAFHRESIEPETVALWVEMLEPWNAEVASKVALSWIKAADQFPTINQFRHAYLGEMKRSKPIDLTEAVEVSRFGLPVKDQPEFVRRWQRARAAGDMRVFPEQIVDGPKWHDDPRYTLAEADEIGIMPDDAYLDES